MVRAGPWPAGGATGPRPARRDVTRPAALALGSWAAQLVVNASWSGVFFGLEAFGAAIAVIVVLDVLVVALIAATWRHDRLAAGMLVPYLLWILYATALNIAIYALN